MLNTSQIDLPIHGLDFKEIKENFISFLKQNPTFSDYNFEGSGINTLLNILAFNSHYIGFYVKMLLNESFVDSATLINTLLSKSKLNGYIPRGKRSSFITLQLKISFDKDQEPENRTLLIPRGSFFLGNNATIDSRKFFLLDTVACYDRTEFGDDEVFYLSPSFTIYEGELTEWKFKSNSSIHNQRFIIKDESIDVSTMKVIVFDSNDENTGTEYKLAASLTDITSNSNVYYLSSNEEGFSEIFFGNNQFGQQPPNGSLIVVEYLRSSGVLGNGCGSFIYQSLDNMGVVDSYTTILGDQKISQGGMDEETIEELRFNIPYHYRAQERAITEADFTHIIKREFGDIDGISVWGGEKNAYKNFGAIYISIKPNKSAILSDFVKNQIKKLLETKCIVGTKIILIDPEIINVNLDVRFNYDRTKTRKAENDMISYITQKIKDFNSQFLGNFDSSLIEVDLFNDIKAKEPSIRSIYSKKTISKRVKLIPRNKEEVQIYLGNEIRPGTLSSSPIIYTGKQYKINDINSAVRLVDVLSGEVLSIDFGRIDYVKGIIFLKLDIDFQSTIEPKSIGYQLVEFQVNPVAPDLKSYLNNILKIKDIRVFIE